MWNVAEIQVRTSDTFALVVIVAQFSMAILGFGWRQGVATPCLGRGFLLFYPDCLYAVAFRCWGAIDVSTTIGVLCFLHHQLILVPKLLLQTQLLDSSILHPPPDFMHFSRWREITPVVGHSPGSAPPAGGLTGLPAGKGRDDWVEWTMLP